MISSIMDGAFIGAIGSAVGFTLLYIARDPHKPVPDDVEEFRYSDSHRLFFCVYALLAVLSSYAFFLNTEDTSLFFSVLVSAFLCGSACYFLADSFIYSVQLNGRGIRVRSVGLERFRPVEQFRAWDDAKNIRYSYTRAALLISASDNRCGSINRFVEAANTIKERFLAHLQRQYAREIARL